MLIQRLVFFFKIPYLDEKRGTYRGVNEMMAVAGKSDREQKISRPQPFAARLMTTEV
jgi:PDZ domain-containing secreted protein